MQSNFSTTIQNHFGHGAAEIHTAYKSFIDNHSDADLAYNLIEQHSVTSTVHLIKDIAYQWQVKKQVKPSANTTGSGTGSLYTGVLQTNIGWNFCSSIGYPIHKPTKIHEENE
eukprot:6391883-Ditylum_brightwellii.AAC.1